MTTRRASSALLLASALACLPGCVAPTNSPSNILDRIDAHRAEYESWPLPVKEAILDGKVVKGMTPAQVLVALGEPQQRISRGGGDEVWVYPKAGESTSGSSNVLRGSSITLGGSSIGGGGIYASPPPIVLGGGGGSIAPNPQEDEVIFRDGRVARGPGIK